MSRLDPFSKNTGSASALLVALCTALCAGPVAAQSAMPAYKLTTFAKSTTTPYSQPDSLVQWHDSVLIGYQNLDNGNLTPIATGFGSTRGMIFVKPDSE